MKHDSPSARFRRALLLLALLSPCLVRAARLDDVMARLNREERRQLGTLAALSPAALRELEEMVDDGALRQDVEAILAATPLSLGERADGAPGPQAWLRERLSPIAGLEWLGEVRERVPVPVPLDQAQTLGPRQDRATHLEAGGKVWPLFPFWPNGALPNLAPESGLKGRMLYVGAAEWSDLKGLDPRGAIALMDFKGGRNWNRLMDLGALAVVVLEDEYVGRPLAERFFANTPLPLPRYFVDRETGAALKALAGAEATVRGGNWWENRTARSLFAWLPPQAAGEKTVREADLLERIAAQFGLDASDLLQENRLASPALKVGQVLDIPGRVETYTVTSRDLLQRLAREWMVTPEQLLGASGGVDPELPPGTRLSIPALEQPVVVLVRLESVSAVPGLPHGANTAANLSIAVRLLELAAKMPEGTRRRGLLVGFLEGDHHGGRASRLFLETLLLDEGKILPAALESNQTTTEEEFFARYLEVEGWLRGEKAAPAEGAALWFGDEWLLNRLNGFRVELAEKRVAAILRLQTELGVDERGATERLVDDLDQRILDLVKLRAESLQSKSLAPLARAETFLKGVDRLAAEHPGVPALSRDALLDRFFEEVEQERLTRELTRINRETVRRVVERVRAGEGDIALDKFRQAWWLDLSGGSASLEVSPIKDYRDQAGIVDANRTTMVERMDRVHAFAARQAGWTDQWAFIGNNVQADFPLLAPIPPPNYAEFWGGLGIGLLSLRAANDPRIQVDTPLDVPEETRFDNLALLARTSLTLLRVNLESAADGTFAGKWKTKPYSRLVGTTTRFNIRSGIDAKDPVPHALVYFPAIREVKGLNADLGFHNTATFMGSRLGVMRFSLLNGRFSLPLEAKTYKAHFEAHAYLPDPTSGLFGLVMEGGQIGTQKQTYAFTLMEGQDTYKNLILHALYPLAVSSGVDPLFYNVPTGTDDLLQIQDAVLNGTPRHYNIDHPRIHFGETEIEGTIVYAEPGRRLRFIDKRLGQLRSVLVGGLDPDDKSDVKGQGVPVGPRGDDRNLALSLSPIGIARDLQDISERRMEIYENFGIRDQALSETLRMSRSKLDQVDAFLEARDWQAAVGAAREAWGMLIKNYPAILRLGREAVLSVVILMGLLAPTSLFLEKLVIGSKHIVSRLGGTVGLFILGTLFLNFFHPAFKIALSPFIVVIAFTMILMAVIVLGICYQRFEVLVRRARIEGGEAESEEISLFSSLNTAFSLGVSNLKKRPTRTALTGFTVTVLTFSIVTFVSVKGQDVLFLRPVRFNLDVKGVAQDRASIQSPAYEGILFRESSWNGVEDSFISAIRTEFGTRYPVATRARYIEVAGGNNAALEGKNQIEIRGAKGREIVTALMAFEPVETEFSGLQRAVSHQAWFLPAEGERLEDRFHIILPERVAAGLKISAADLVDAEGKRLPDDKLPEVRMRNRGWRVIGILDTDAADRIRDINGESTALVDYLRSAITPSTGTGRLENEDDHVYMNWEDLAIVPVSARNDIGASWHSLAVKFPEGHDFPTFRKEMSRRMDRAMYAYVDGEHSLMSARKQGSVGGLAKVLVPVILCILIVSNTMMGTVDERVGEVQMLGAIGLSPAQISFLLLSESTVFSLLGIIFGTFSGLLFSRAIGWFPDSLGLLSFNFTSLASTFLAMGTGAIVLIATLVPARRAAAMAAPSGMDRWELPPPEEGGLIRFRLPFTLTRGNAIGMAAFFRRFLLNHADSSSADFISKGAKVTRAADGADLRVESHLWLAPYDLDVAQDLSLHIDPTGTEGVYGVTIHLRRGSGSEDAWVRTNYGFLDMVRKQFLLWRNLSPALRRRYIQEGANELSSQAIPALSQTAERSEPA